MRTALFAFGFALISVLAAAQDWRAFLNEREGFSADFPGAPHVSETMWTSEHGYRLPARIYAGDRGKEHYSVTVVDYSSIEQQGIDRAKACPAGAETCLGSDFHGAGYWKNDMRGAEIYATGRLLKQRNVTLMDLSRGEKGPVAGHELHLINNADQSQTFAFVGMRNSKLYIVEGTVPKGAPPPALFLNSVEFPR